MSRILLFGANGRLGQQLHGLLATACTVDAPLRSEVDLSHPDLGHQLTSLVPPAIVVNCAAYTNVDAAESDRQRAHDINAVAVGTIAKWCRDIGAWLIHFSTDYVFDGEKGSPYVEEDETNPVNEYGATKREGELRALDANERTIILRVAWLYDHQGPSFIRTMMRLATMRGSLSVASDQVGNPTYVRPLAEQTLRVISAVRQGHGVGGVFHLASPDFVSRYDLVSHLGQRLGWDCHIEPVASATFATPAKRPLFTALNSHRIEAQYGVRLPDWKEQLNLALAEWQGDRSD